MDTNESAGRKRRRRPRFSLGALFLVITVLAIWVGLRTNRARDQRLVIDTVLRLEGVVRYDWEPDGKEEMRRNKLRDEARAAGLPMPVFEDRPPGPKWLHGVLGPEYFQSLTLVGINGHEATLSDRELSAIGRQSQLQVLSLRNLSLTDESVAKISNLDGLKRLALPDSRLTDDGLSQLSHFEELEYLDLSRTLLTDESVPILQKSFPKLKRLELRETGISVVGFRAFQDGLPNTSVAYQPSATARKVLPKRLQQMVIPPPD